MTEGKYYSGDGFAGLMKKQAANRCAVCPKGILPKMDFCMAHWKQIPKLYRERIETATKAGHIPMKHSAVNDAIQWFKDRQAGVQAQ